VRVTAPPEKGKANDQVERLLSDVLGAKVKIRSGMRGRAKVFDVSRIEIDTVRRKLGL
jgi:uncharacterized protein YggU (UPF0235/DUF167 family)